MGMNSTMNSTQQKRDHPGVAALLTIWAARSSVRPTVCACWPAEKRSTGAAPDAWLSRGDGGRLFVWPRRQLAAGPLLAHMQPMAERGGIRPGWPSATGSGPRVILEVSTVSTPPATVWAKRSSERGAGPSSCIFVPSRS